MSQILEKDPAQPNGPPQTSMVEIGPRFVMTPIRIFEGAFGGATVFSNPGLSPYISVRIYTSHSACRIRVPRGRSFCFEERTRTEIPCSQGGPSGEINSEGRSAFGRRRVCDTEGLWLSFTFHIYIRVTHIPFLMGKLSQHLPFRNWTIT